MMLNHNLYSVCRDALNEGLKFLNSKNNETHQKDKIALVVDSSDELLRLQEVQNMRNALENIPELTTRIKKLISPETKDTIIFTINWDFIEKFFLAYVRKNGFVFNEKEFAQLYSELEEYIYGKADYRYLSAAFNLRMEDESLTIDDIIVRKITDKEFMDLFGIPKEVYQMNMILFGPVPEFLLEVISKEYNMAEQQKKIQDFTYVFGLFKSQSLQIREFTCFFPRFYPVELRSSTEVLIRRGKSHDYPVLYKKEFLDFINFYKYYKKIQKPLSLETAIRRFNYGLQALDMEDVVIDFMIALECLFGDKKPNLTRTISTRVALLLGRNDFDTERLRNIVIKLYNIRSTIVHGDDLKESFKKVKITENCVKQKLKQITNESIIAYLNIIEKGKSIDYIKNELDISISNNNLRKELQKLSSYPIIL